MIPATRLLRNFWSARWSAHDDAINAEYRDRSLSGQLDRPVLCGERVQVLVLHGRERPVRLMLEGET